LQISNGGGIYFASGTKATFTRVNLNGNLATSQGGGIYLSGSTAGFADSTLNSNNAGDTGGAVFVISSFVTLFHVAMDENIAPSGNSQ